MFGAMDFFQKVATEQDWKVWYIQKQIETYKCPRHCHSFYTYGSHSKSSDKQCIPHLKCIKDLMWSSSYSLFLSYPLSGHYTRFFLFIALARHALMQFLGWKLWMLLFSHLAVSTVHKSCFIWLRSFANFELGTQPLQKLGMVETSQKKIYSCITFAGKACFHSLPCLYNKQSSCLDHRIEGKREVH